jgi:hypothetical protein
MGRFIPFMELQSISMMVLFNRFGWQLNKLKRSEIIENYVPFKERRMLAWEE